MIETKRGSSDATYLYYTLGKLQIMKLRADVMAQQGSAFNLQTFHDSFMRQGFAPSRSSAKPCCITTHQLSSSTSSSMPRHSQKGASHMPPRSAACHLIATKSR